MTNSNLDFRLLIEGVKDYAIILLNPQGIVVTWNSGAERIKGYRADEIIGRHFSLFYLPEDRAQGKPEQALARAVREGTYAREDWRLRKDGEQFRADVLITTLWNDDGSLRGFVKVTRDVTARNKAQDALRDSEIRYRRLFETAADGILIIDAQSEKIVDANPFVAELLDCDRERLNGKELWQIGLFENAAETRAAFESLAETGRFRVNQRTLETRARNQIHVEIVGSRFQVNDHAVIQCNIRDITERIQLVRAKLDAELSADLLRRKDEFLAMISHEMRNPLAPITNALHLMQLKADNENSDHAEARAVLERQVDQLKRLIGDLLEISRVSTGRIELRLEQIDLRQLADRAIESARPTIEKSGHRLSVCQSPTPLWLNADPARLEQIIVNLLTNAAKYTTTGGKIWLTTESDGDEAMVRVRDTGVGIDPELVPRIFDLFTQADHSLDRSQGGLGIGLTIVKKLVEMHQGQIAVASSPGRGSEFVVRLPRLTEPPEPIEQANSESPSESTPENSGLRVLVVDDNVDAARLLAKLLQTADHKVRLAFDGLTAVEAAVDFRPDVVLLDIGLPGLDGYEVARRIQQKFPDTVLVAITGYGDPTDQESTQDAGFQYHLVKPVGFDRVEEILAASTPSRSA